MSIHRYSFNKVANNSHELVGKYIFKEGILVCPCYALIGRVLSVSGVTATVQVIPINDMDAFQTVKTRLSTINLFADTIDDVFKVKVFSRKQIAEYHNFMKSQKENYQNFPDEI